jgi:hypothetical protein
MDIANAPFEIASIDDDENSEDERIECRELLLVDALALSPGIVRFCLPDADLYFPLKERARNQLVNCITGATIDESDRSMRISVIMNALRVPSAETLRAALRMELQPKSPFSSGDFLAGAYCVRPMQLLAIQLHRGQCCRDGVGFPGWRWPNQCAAAVVAGHGINEEITEFDLKRWVHVNFGLLDQRQPKAHFECCYHYWNDLRNARAHFGWEDK